MWRRACRIKSNEGIAVQGLWSAGNVAYGPGAFANKKSSMKVEENVNIELLAC